MLTQLERIVIEAILNNEYSIDGPIESVPYLWSVSNDLKDKVKGKALSGVISSLVQKEFVETYDSEGDGKKT